MALNWSIVLVLGVKVILEVSDIFPKNDVDKIMKKFE